MAACYLLRSFKCQKGQGSAVMSIYVFFVSFRIAFRIFVIFAYLSISFRFFASHFVFYFVYVRTTDKNEQVTWTSFRILYFVCFSYCFVCFSYFVVSSILMDSQDKRHIRQTYSGRSARVATRPESQAAPSHITFHWCLYFQQLYIFASPLRCGKAEQCD